MKIEVKLPDYLREWLESTAFEDLENMAERIINILEDQYNFWWHLPELEEISGSFPAKGTGQGITVKLPKDLCKWLENLKYDDGKTRDLELRILEELEDAHALYEQNLVNVALHERDQGGYLIH